jgi:hypothetical protein
MGIDSVQLWLQKSLLDSLAEFLPLRSISNAIGQAVQQNV